MIEEMTEMKDEVEVEDQGAGHEVEAEEGSGAGVEVGRETGDVEVLLDVAAEVVIDLTGEGEEIEVPLFKRSKGIRGNLYM